MDLKMTDITRVLPVSKLSTILKKHGFSVSDIFNRDANALKIVGKAMKSVKSQNEDRKCLTLAKLQLFSKAKVSFQLGCKNQMSKSLV